MDKPCFRYLFRPEIERPVFVQGLPGFGNVGMIAAQLLIESIHAKEFAQMYSPSFPDFVVVNSKGICQTPRWAFYTSSVGKNHFMVLTGNVQPSQEDVVAYYNICGEILDFVDSYDCRYVLTMGGIPTPKSRGQVFVAATSSKLASKIAKMGIPIYGGGKIVGLTGLMLGLAKSRGWDGVCLLGATTGLEADQEAGFSVFKFLTKMLGIENTVS